MCGNPYRALSRRQGGKQTSSKHARNIIALVCYFKQWILITISQFILVENSSSMVILRPVLLLSRVVKARERALQSPIEHVAIDDDLANEIKEFKVEHAK